MNGFKFQCFCYFHHWIWMIDNGKRALHWTWAVETQVEITSCKQTEPKKTLRKSQDSARRVHDLNLER